MISFPKMNNYVRPENKTLVFRAKVLGALRRFFDSRDFVEVETPVRIVSPAPEEHIDCPLVPKSKLDYVSYPATDTYLRASPELQMKKLLAAGMERIYQIGPCFREGELGSRHSPEFTMMEWYRKGGSYIDIKNDFSSLLTYLSNMLPEEKRLDKSVKTLSVREAYQLYAGWDPWEGKWDQDRFDFDMATKIEMAFKEMGGGFFLMDYPPQAASLAKISDKGYLVAERWEFYFDGIELANCFSELCDESEQRERFEKARESRHNLGELDYPLDEEFLSSLELIGSAAGVALGVDRLLMAMLGIGDIAAVKVTD